MICLHCKMLFIIWVFLFTSLACSSKLNVEYKWKYVEYDWDSKEQMQNAIESGDYDLTKSVIYDVDKDRYNNRIFITVARDKGVPSSLNIVTNKNGKGGPIVKPYPDWSWTDIKNCKTIISVYRVAIDKCNRLWVVDNGYVGDDKVCPPKLLAFDLSTDKLIGSYKISENIATNRKGEGFLATPVVQTEGPHCQNTMVYISDVSGYGMVIWNTKKFWRLNGKMYEPRPEAYNVTIAGETVSFTDGIIGMALAKRDYEPERLYSHAYSSFDVYSASTDDLIDSAYSTSVLYERYQNVLPSQSAAMASSGEILFFGLSEQMSMVCHNVRNEFIRDNLETIAQDDKTLQFASGVKVFPMKGNNGPQQLWVLTNRLQKVAAGTMNFEEVNFRILVGSVSDLIKGTKCDLPHH